MPTEGTTPRPEPSPDAGVDEIQSDIEQTRKELGNTVNALTAKADISGRAKAKVSDTQAEIAEKAHAAQAAVRESPVPVGAVLAAVGIAVVAALLWRRRRR